MTEIIKNKHGQYYQQLKKMVERGKRKSFMPTFLDYEDDYDASRLGIEEQSKLTGLVMRDTQNMVKDRFFNKHIFFLFTKYLVDGLPGDETLSYEIRELFDEFKRNHLNEFSNLIEIDLEVSAKEAKAAPNGR